MPTLPKEITPKERLQKLLAIAIRNGSKHGESLHEIEATLRFVAAAFYYRDSPSFEAIVARENDDDIVNAAHEAMRRAGLWGSK